MLPAESSFHKSGPKITIEGSSTKPTLNNPNMSSEHEIGVYNMNKDGYEVLAQGFHSDGDLSHEFIWNDLGQEEPKVKSKSVSTLTMVVKQESLRQGTLRLMCKATLYHLYSAHQELTLAAEKPQTASVLVLATGHTHSGKL